MALKDTTKKLKALLAAVSNDLEKSESGNKAAAQRARTATIAFSKMAKVFRAESISSSKKPKVVVPAAMAKKTKALACQTSVSPAKRATAKIPVRKR